MGLDRVLSNGCAMTIDLRKPIDFENVEPLFDDDGNVVVPPKAARWVLDCLTHELARSRQRMDDWPIIQMLQALQFAAIRESESSADRPFSSGSGRIELETDAPNFWVSGQVAELLGCTERSVRKMCASGRLPASKSGVTWLIAPADLETFRHNKRGKNNGKN